LDEGKIRAHMARISCKRPGINLLGGKLSNWQNGSSTMLKVSILHIFIDID
jgi:hypothetical protein